MWLPFIGATVNKQTNSFIQLQTFIYNGHIYIRNSVKQHRLLWQNIYSTFVKRLFLRATVHTRQNKPCHHYGFPCPDVAVTNHKTTTRCNLWRLPTDSKHYPNFQHPTPFCVDNEHWYI